MKSPGYLVRDPQEILNTVAAPGAVFIGTGVTKNAYLSVGTITSDKTGFPIRLNNAQLTFMAVSNSDNTASFQVELYKFDGTTETYLDTISVVNSRGADYKPVTPISIDYGTELRAKINNTGTAKDPVFIAFTTGEVP